MKTLALTCHPGTPPDAVVGVTARVARAGHADLALGFRLEATLARVRVPPPRPPRATDLLWQHTCFEAFIALESGSAYHELNFAPSGEWAAYAFRCYRERTPPGDERLAPRITVRCASDALELDARVPLDRLSPAHPQAPLRIGLAAVIEGIDGTLSYWSLHHPPGKPDFHHRDALALWLEPPAGE